MSGLSDVDPFGMRSSRSRAERLFAPGPQGDNNIDHHYVFWFDATHEVWRTGSQAVAGHRRRFVARGHGRAAVVDRSACVRATSTGANVWRPC